MLSQMVMRLWLVGVLLMTLISPERAVRWHVRIAGGAGGDQRAVGHRLVSWRMLLAAVGVILIWLVMVLWMKSMFRLQQTPTCLHRAVRQAAEDGEAKAEEAKLANSRQARAVQTEPAACRRGRAMEEWAEAGVPGAGATMIPA